MEYLYKKKGKQRNVSCAAAAPLETYSSDVATLAVVVKLTQADELLSAAVVVVVVMLHWRWVMRKEAIHH